MFSSSDTGQRRDDLPPISLNATSSHSTEGRHKATGIFPYLLAALTALAVVAGGRLWLQRPAPPPVAIQAPPTPLPTETPAPTATPLPSPTPPPITVYVSGAVARPGLYQLPAEARVGDALHAAGGLTDAAGMDLINQAEKLWDGAHVRAPSGDEAAPAFSGSLGGSGGVASNAANSASLAGGGRVNLNSATLEQLVALPGIGPSKAQAIINHRPYTSVDDLERAPGIGPSTVNQLRNLVTAP